MACLASLPAAVLGEEGKEGEEGQRRGREGGGRGRRVGVGGMGVNIVTVVMMDIHHYLILQFKSLVSIHVHVVNMFMEGGHRDGQCGVFS